jgi:DNA mismatch repair protein MutS2
VLALEEDSAWLEVSGKRMLLKRLELEPVASTRSRPSPSARPAAPSSPGSSTNVSTSEVNVIGRRLDEAIDEVERALDAAILGGDGSLRIVHGHGTGRLRDGLREHLRSHRAVASIRAADAREGGNGATIAALK